MTESLTIESDEAAALARELAERRGMSIDAAVRDALRASLSRMKPSARQAVGPMPVPTLEEMTPEQRARYESLRALTREAAPYRLPGATSDHSDMYDEHGLPI